MNRIPLYGGQGDADSLYVFREFLLPVAREYAPELILVSAGFDTHRNDPLAGMGMSGGAYGRLSAILQELAEECCPGRLAFTLEGGYDRTALTDGVAAVLSSLILISPYSSPSKYRDKVRLKSPVIVTSPPPSMMVSQPFSLPS